PARSARSAHHPWGTKAWRRSLMGRWKRPAITGGAQCRSARPEQDVFAGAFVALDQARIERCREAGIVDLDREIIALVAAGLDPGCADLDVDVIRVGEGEPIVRCPVGILLYGHEPGVGIDGEGYDLALDGAVLALGESADGAHSVSPFACPGRAHRGLVAVRRSGTFGGAPLAAQDGRRAAFLFRDAKPQAAGKSGAAPLHRQVDPIRSSHEGGREGRSGRTGDNDAPGDSAASARV